MNSDIDYGDTVRVNEKAPGRYHPGEMGAACGFWQVEVQEIATKYGEELGTTMCTVEFDDGETVEIPTQLLTKVG